MREGVKNTQKSVYMVYGWPLGGHNGEIHFGTSEFITLDNNEGFNHANKSYFRSEGFGWSVLGAGQNSLDPSIFPKILTNQ